jgi:hypothetical protein
MIGSATVRVRLAVPVAHICCLDMARCARSCYASAGAIGCHTESAAALASTAARTRWT